MLLCLFQDKPLLMKYVRKSVFLELSYVKGKKKYMLENIHYNFNYIGTWPA